MPKTTTWALPDHSAAKHEMLRRYLQVWYAKLASTGARRRGSQLNYIDAFAGPGIYDGGEPGSPIVALTTLIDHGAFVNWANVQFFFYFVNKDEETHESLKTQVEALWARREGGCPPNIKVRFEHKSFFDTVEELTEISRARGGAVIGLPTFAFVDPFGFSNLPIASLCTLLRTGSCEVLFNFMYNDINRFFTYENEKHRTHLMTLFDFDVFPSVDGLGPAEREALLNEHIEEVFRRRGNFEYVRSFQMEGQTRRTLYSLFFATHRIEGLEIMKDVMWKIDPVEGRRFSDRVSDQLTLFEGEPDFPKLRRLVLARLAVSSATSPALMDFATVETDFRSAHLKSNVLKPLEKEGVIVVTSPNPNRRKGTFPEECSISLA